MTPPLSPDRYVSRVDTLLFLACVALSVAALSLPEPWRDSIARSLRQTVLAPLLAVQQQSELLRTSRKRFADLEGERDSAMLAATFLPELRNENARLRKLLGLGSRLGSGYVAAEVLHQAERRDAAGVDHALDAGGQRLARQALRALDVGAQDFRRIARPQAIVGSDVEQVSHVLQGRLERAAVGQVADHHLAVEAGEIVARAGRANQRAHAHAALDQGAHDGRSQKTRSAGNEGQIARPQGSTHDMNLRRREAVRSMTVSDDYVS